jgi:hypothetical protein
MPFQSAKTSLWRYSAPQVIEAMIAHPAVKKVNFTGSTAMERIIAGRAARHYKPTLIELGGKVPVIVYADADLDEAAQAAITGVYLHVCLPILLFRLDALAGLDSLPFANGHNPNPSSMTDGGL